MLYLDNARQAEKIQINSPRDQKDEIANWKLDENKFSFGEWKELDVADNCQCRSYQPTDLTIEQIPQMATRSKSTLDLIRCKSQPSMSPRPSAIKFKT